MAMASVNLRIPPVNSPVNLSSMKSLTLGSNLSIPTSTSSPSLSLSISPLYIYCGRGDKKTARGKRFNHSWGNARPQKRNKGRGPPRVYAPPAPPRKDKYGDDDFVEVDLGDSESKSKSDESPLK